MINVINEYFIKCLNIFRAIRARGGLIIVDEVQTGLGRTGDYMWGFMNYEVSNCCAYHNTLHHVT